MYKSFKIENFRGIKKCELTELKRINIFLGKNNCGKSSILEAIFLLTGYNNPILSVNIDLFRNLGHNKEEDFSFIFYNLNYALIPTLSADLQLKQSNISLEIIPESAEKIQKSINTSELKSTLSPLTNSIENSNIDNINSLLFKASVKLFHKEKEIISTSIIAEKKDNLFNLKVKPSNKKLNLNIKGVFLGNGFRNPTEIIQRLDKMIIDKSKADIISNLKNIDTNIKDIVTSNGLVYIDIGANKMIPANLMGDGFLKYLAIIANMYSVKGQGIILIDEIDNGLHFKTLKNILKLILKSAKEYDIQVFITTHSKEVLMILKNLFEEDTTMLNYKDEINVSTVSKNESGILNVYNYNSDSFHYAMENNIEIRGEF